jgi:hypothetical protein
MSIKWGTDSKVQYIEPLYGFPLSIGVSGEMSLKVENSRKLLLKLVGTESILNQQKLVAFLKSFLITKVKSYIAQVMRVNAINIFEIDEKLMVFSEEIKKMLIQDYQEYGLELTQFFVTNVVKPDGERQYEKFKELHFRKFIEIEEARLRQQTELINANTEAQKTIIESQPYILLQDYVTNPSENVKNTQCGARIVINNVTAILFISLRIYKLYHLLLRYTHLHSNLIFETNIRPQSERFFGTMMCRLISIEKPYYWALMTEIPTILHSL